MPIANAPRAQLRACSGCAGEYEDPERTAWSDVCDEKDASEDNAESAKQPAPRERFPVAEE